MNTILIYTLGKKFGSWKAPWKILKFGDFKPPGKFYYYSKNLEFRKPLNLKFGGNLDSDDLNCGNPCKFSNSNEILD